MSEHDTFSPISNMECYRSYSILAAHIKLFNGTFWKDERNMYKILTLICENNEVRENESESE